MDSKSSSGYRSRLRRRIAQVGHGLCLGVDPHLASLPAFFAAYLRDHGAAAFLSAYSAALIDAAAGECAAIKFQSAFYEAHGSAGFASLEQALADAKGRGLITILDAKRGDISSTMAAYAQMAFGHMQADALTVMPYMGLDSMEPLVPWLRQGRGVYVVWVSSNKSGALVQDLVAGPLLQALVNFCADGGVDEGLGLVLGATKVDALASSLTSRLRDICLLMPGVGAQGGVVTAAIKALMAAGGDVLVPQSRSLSDYPAETASWQEYSQVVKARVKAAARELAVGP